MRIITTALAICAVSFVVDVVGDLSIARHPSDAAQAAAAHAEVPPYLANAVRAHPLPAPPAAHQHRHSRAAEPVAAPVEKAQSGLKDSVKASLDAAKNVPDFVEDARFIQI